MPGSALGGGPTTKAGMRRRSSPSRILARLSRDRAREIPEPTSARPMATTTRWSIDPSACPCVEKRRCTSASQRSERSAEVSPGRAAGKTSMRLSAPCSLATARPSHPQARASPTPARSSSPSAMIRIRESGSGAGVMGTVGTGTSCGTGTSTLTASRATGRTRGPRAGSGLEGPVEQILLLDLVRRVRTVAGEADAGRETTRSVRPTSTAKFIAMKVQAPWFSGSSWTHTSCTSW